MSVQQLRQPVMAGLVAAARERVTETTRVPARSLGDFELSDSIAALAELESMLTAYKLELLAEADQRELAEREAAANSGAWAAQLTGSTAAVMRGGIWLAKMLRERYEHTRVAFATGKINEAQARVIVKAAERLPGQITETERFQAEENLVAKAVAGMNAKNLRRAAKRMLDKVRDDLSDQHEAEETRREEAGAENETWFGIWDNGNGTYSGKFTIPELHGRLLATILDKLTAPRRLSRNKKGEPVTDESVEAGFLLSWYEHAGLAFCELLEHLPTEGHHGVGATLLVKIDHQHLRDGLASAGLDTGATLSAGEALRLSCNAGIMPAVFGGDPLPLHLGRTRRLHTEAQRRAVSFRYDSCATEGCDRPFAWTEIHHPEPWAEGGRTDLDNALPLCFFHHKRAHDTRFTMKHLANGEVRFHRRR